MLLAVLQALRQPSLRYASIKNHEQNPPNFYDQYSARTSPILSYASESGNTALPKMSTGQLLYSYQIVSVREKRQNKVFRYT